MKKPELIEKEESFLIARNSKYDPTKALDKYLESNIKPTLIHSKVQPPLKLGNNLFKAVTCTLLALLVQLLSPVVSNPCGSVNNIGGGLPFGTILDKKIAANNTLITVDYYGIYRILDISTKNVIFEYDLKPEMSTQPAPTVAETVTYVQFAFIIEDDLVILSNDKSIYR